MRACPDFKEVTADRESLNEISCSFTKRMTLKDTVEKKTITF